MSYFNEMLLDVHPEFTDLDAVDRAAEFARNADAAVKVVHVVEDYPEDMREWWNVHNPLKLHERIVNDRQRFLDDIATRVKAAGVDHVESMLRWGREFLEITREVVRNHQQLVVTTFRRRGLLPGTRASCPCITGLCRYTPSAVWVSPTKSARLARRRKGIVASLGGGDDLDDKILKMAASMAKAEGSELHIIHAVSSQGGKGLTGQAAKPNTATYLSGLRSQIKEDSNTTLDDIGVRVTDDCVHLALGAATAVLPALIQELGLDVIVMGTHARDGISGLLVGNTVEKIMPRVNCGVVVVKPDDFLSLVVREEGVRM